MCCRWLLESCAGRVALQGVVAAGMDPKDAGTHALLADAAALLIQVRPCTCCQSVRCGREAEQLMTPNRSSPAAPCGEWHVVCDSSPGVQVSQTCRAELVPFVQTTVAPTLGIQPQAPVRLLIALQSCEPASSAPGVRWS